MLPTTRRQTEDCFFIHNCLGSFFSGVLNWFADDYYPRFQYKVIGTYDKAVKFFKDKKQMGVDPSGNILPSITLDPILDFSNEEKGGRFLWQHSNYAPGLGFRLWKSIDLKEQDVTVTPVFSRYQGTFEIIFWLSSIYELMDFRVSLLQFCGGYGRWLRPEYMWSYLILPEQIENFEVDGVKLDWSNTYADLLHIDTINKHRLAVPIALDGMWKLDSFSDNSTKYGADQLAEYKLSATFTYEINLPTYVVLNTKLNPTLKIQFSMGDTYTKYPLASPFKILQAVSEVDPTQKYMTEQFQLYKIENDLLERTNLIYEFTDNIVWPQEIQKWNCIVSGKLIPIDMIWLSDPQNIVHKDQIIYFDKYRPEYLPAIRKCLGVISRNDTQTDELYKKCELLQKPLLSRISADQIQYVQSVFNEVVTLDSYNQKLYRGALAVIESNTNDPVTGYKTVEKIKADNPAMYETAIKKLKDDDPNNKMPDYVGGPAYSDQLKKRMIKDNCNGFQTAYPLDYIIDPSSETSLLVYIDDTLTRNKIDYTIQNGNVIIFNEPPPSGSTVYIGGNYLIIKESKLMALYEFTADDEKDLNPVVIPLTVKIVRIDDIVLLSYGGRLEYERDYTIDLDKQEVSIKLKPKTGEIIEFFYYLI